MADIEAFSRLSLSPFLCATLSTVGTAWQKIQERYPNNKPFPTAAADWVSHASRISQASTGNDGVDGQSMISPSMCRLAAGESVDLETMEACLGLLRAQASAFATISAVRTVTHVNDLGGDGIDSTTIVPFQDGDGWAFAVAYPDCIHWYDSRRDREAPRLSAGNRPVVSGWTGPKEPRDRTEDSGVIMLMGIRRVYQGAPHLSQEAADQARPSFRARLVAELSCGKLEPSDEEFSAVLHQSEEPPSFFADASFFDVSPGTDPTPAVAGPPRPHPTRPDRAQPSTTDVGGSRLGVRHPQPASAIPSARTPSARRHRSRVYSDDRRMILGYLSDAILAKRSLQASGQTSLAVLWESVKRRGLGSVFHERYNAVLFHDRMKLLSGRDEVVKAMNYPIEDVCLKNMKSEEKQCHFWRNVCDLRRDWGPGQYTLLLSVSRTLSAHKLKDEEKRRVVSNLRARLDDPSDPLERWLKRAQPMCKALTTDALPDERLSIDTFHLKPQGPISDDDYDALTNPDPRAKRALPRLRTNATERT